VSVGIFGRIHCQFLPVEVKIRIEFFEPEIAPEKILELNPAFSERQLGSIIKLCMGRKGKATENEGKDERYPGKIEAYFIPFLGIHGFYRKWV
jgi:hypothetical protein